MAYTSGTTTSSGSGGSDPGSESDLQLLMEQRKRKRLASNRESARRSRVKKQKHMDDLTTRLIQLSRENRRIMSSVGIATQSYVSVEAENSVLRAQVAELSHRLQSLNEIIAFMNHPLDLGCGFGVEEYGGGGTEFVNELMNNQLSYLHVNQPILATVDMIQY